MNLIMISFISSTLFIFLKHPLSMGMILLTQTITTSLVLGYFNLNYWFSYIMFLIMIGGMLILFIYMTSVASNEKFIVSLKLLMFTLSMILIMVACLFIIKTYFININNWYNESMVIFTNYKLSLNKYFNYSNNIIMYLLIIYLLVTLIAVVKLTDSYKGPLRSIN